jgi:hypothetical protein
VVSNRLCPTTAAQPPAPDHCRAEQGS